MTGSKMDIPKELFEQIKFLEDLFTVEPKKLKEITDHFITELDKGMNSYLMYLISEANSCKVSALREEALYGTPPTPFDPPLTIQAHEPNLGHVLP